MSHGKDLGYSINKIFLWLFALTAVEIGWAMPEFIREKRLLLWSGLIACMLVKGLLIFMYFMHMKFERFIIWGLIVPTPFLVAVVLFANMPDTVYNEDIRVHPVGYLIDETGNVVNALDPHHPAKGRGKPHGLVDETAPAEH